MTRYHYYEKAGCILVTGLDDCMGDWGTIYGSWDEFNKLSDEEKDELGEKALAEGYVYAMLTKKMTREIAAYCRNNIEDFEERVQLALKKMGRMRCPFSMADQELYDDIVNCICEWCEDNDYSVDFFEDWDEVIEGNGGILWEC